MSKYKTAPSTDRAAIERYLSGLKERGWAVVAVDDGEGYEKTPGETVSQSLERIMAVESANVKFAHPEVARCHVIFFLMQNEPDCVFADGTMGERWDEDVEAVEKDNRLGVHA